MRGEGEKKLPYLLTEKREVFGKCLLRRYSDVGHDSHLHRHTHTFAAREVVEGRCRLVVRVVMMMQERES